MYKKTATLFFLMVAALWPVAEAWGQEAQEPEYVTGDKYRTSGTIETKYRVTVADDDNENLQKAFDGDRNNTWWDASSNGPRTITVSLDNSTTLSKINYYGGGNGTNVTLRPAEIQFYYSSDGSDWKRFYTESNIDRTVRDMTITIPNYSRVSSKYYRIVFVPGTKVENGQTVYESLAFNEITLYNQSGDQIDVSKKVQEINNLDQVSIQHKAAKWFDLRSEISDAAKNMDTFNDETAWYSGPKGKIQASHVYMDTIYVHKGTSVTLAVPDRLSNSSVVSYQRWYSYRTDGTFRTQNTGRNEVWDLLTPVGTTPYRFANGYVGKPLTTSDVMDMKFYVPTDEEFKAWFGETAAQTFDNNYYLVGCDVSGYTDFTKSYSDASGSSSFYPSNQSDGLTYEPTLTHRIIYYIMAVDGRDTGEGATVTWQNGMGRLKNTAYQGGTTTGKYLEEYDISFPFTRISNNTKELVALSKDAQSYAIPDAAIDDDNDVLDVKLVDNGSGITLATTSLSGTSRIIQFNYPNPNYSDGTEYVNANNSTATIYVTKTVSDTTYNIAKYNLTFVRDTRLLTQTQLEQIENGTIQDNNLKYYQFRTDKYLSENYQLLTKLDFDYDPSVSKLYGQPDFYQFPLNWTSSSYSFYDGADSTDFKGQSGYFPEWGYYSIMNGFIEDKYWTSGTLNHAGKLLPNSTYHMFIDASDRAGVIARLPFEQKLCSGSEMFVTAWVKSAGYSSTTPDAGMLFSVMGVKKDEATGQDVYVPIYRHSSSQIRRTDYLTGGMPGTGTGTNEWLQMYFSFIVENDALYDSYVLQVDNNSESTKGGDMYIDDIRVYLATPSAVVTQLEATCTNERTMMSIKLDWDRLLSRLGEKEGTGQTDAIDFCFIDKAKYEDYLAQHSEDYQGAIENSVVEVGNNNPDLGGEYYNQKYNTLYFKLNFDENTDYDSGAHPRLARDNGDGTGKYYFYRTTDEAGTKSLAVDFYSALTPNRSYLMLIQVNDGNQATAADFAEDINDPCGINTPFYVTAQTLLRVNGEVVDPTTDFCAGQILNFSAQMRVPVSEDDGTESYIIIDKGVYFDWFFGTEDEFLAENADYGDVTLLSALTTFRDIYPDNEDLTGVEAGYHKTIDGQTVNLSDDMIRIINYYVTTKTAEDGLHSMLILHKENLDITLLESGLQLVVQPIPTLQSPDGTISDDLWSKVCWSYIPLELKITGNAPQLRAGFNSVRYPSNTFNPNLRIGLDQINTTSDEAPLVVNLREVQVTSENVNNLGMITSVSPDIYNKIYLVGTDDPAYNNDKYFPTDFGQFSLPIGKLISLHARENGFADENIMKICFDTKNTQDNGFQFQPKEGYTYTFAVHFEEKVNDNASNACFGTFNVSMKVVPEYMEWAGKTQDGKYANWNNDDNWKRIASVQMKKTNVTDTDKDYFTDGMNNTTNGFVPMIFTKVIMPENSQVELYAAGYDADGSWGYGTGVAARPDHIAAPTDNIQYDLMAYKHPSDDQTFPGQLKTERYRVSLLDEIHFEPGAEMKHAEYLLYNKAWVDYELTGGRWYTLASPLKAVYAGDFYTDKSGTEGSEYFQPIEFKYGTNSTDNNRFNPSVYQRGWKGNAILQTLNNETKDVAISGNWSALYNDVAEAYTPGSGFSLKVQDATGNVTFRLPKADGSYKYYSYDGKTSGDPTTISRDVDASGRLKSDELLDRRTDNASLSTSFTIELADEHGDYYLVGNPFMAHLDMKKFFDKNTSFAKMYWLVTEKGQEVAVGGSGDGLISTGTGKIAPLQSFFVKLKTDEAGNLVEAPENITFTQDMQTLGGTNDGLRSANALTITATTTDGRTSRAAVAYDMAASADYEASEDAELFLDSNLGDVPMVYTVAGTMATSINRTSELYNIPLGVYGSKQEMVTLSFGGLNQFSSATLYDAQEQTETPLREGKTVSVPATSGRYFLRAGTPTGNEVIARNAFLVYSVGGGKVMVTSSNTPLKDIRVYTMGGAQVRSIQASGMQQEIYLNRGIYLITVSDQDGLQETKKVLVR